MECRELRLMTRNRSSRSKRSRGSDSRRRVHHASFGIGLPNHVTPRFAVIVCEAWDTFFSTRREMA